MSDKKTLKEIILEKEKEGKVVIAVAGGMLIADLEDIIKQPTEGLLYDLNRDKVTLRTFMNEDESKWRPTLVNDYCVMLVITKLKEYYDKNKTS